MIDSRCKKDHTGSHPALREQVRSGDQGGKGLDVISGKAERFPHPSGSDGERHSHSRKETDLTR